MLKKLVLVFISAFILNWAWEISHSALYSNYQAGPITGFILFRAGIADAVIILMLVFAAQKFKLNKSLFVVIGGLIAAIAIEIWALKTGRWAYNQLMPVIPFVKIGLTPLVQLAATGFVAVKLFFREK